MDPDSVDIGYMRIALAEARKGLGRTAPNPCVGAVIVKDGQVIAKGYHKKAGTPHAEVLALNRAGNEAEKATLYVTLEPCCHTGKTPPCSHAVVEAGINRVVIGMLDPNPLVDGGGIKYLRDHNVSVTAGILSSECISINRPFIQFITSGRPLVILKAGVSLDGRLNYESGKSGWITGPESAAKVHQLRDRCDAILVGSHTVRIDNPSLTTRMKDRVGRDSIRIILDSNLSTPLSAKVLNIESEAPTWIFCNKNIGTDKITMSEDRGLKVFPVGEDSNGYLDLAEVIEILGKKSVTSVLVEGGGIVHASFLRRQLVDQVCLFYAPLFAGNNGVSLATGLNIDDREHAIRLMNVRYTRLGDDIMVEGDVKYSDATV